MTPNARQWITLIVIAGHLASLVAYDIFAASVWGVETTISRVSGRLIAAYPVLVLAIVFAFGILVGHTLFPQGVGRPSK